MCSGRSAEELSSERKTLTFAKGPCNKAKKTPSRQIQRCPATQMWGCTSSGMQTGMGQVQWFGNGLGLSREGNTPGQECYVSGMKWWRQSEWEGPPGPG